MNPIIVDSAKVMSKGQITLPKDIREALQLNSGDRVTLVYENGQVIMMIDKLVDEIRTEVEN